jgi:hypothetical protein
MTRKALKIKKSTRKRIGRPPTGKGRQVVVRLQPPLFAELDAWVTKQNEPRPTHAEAIRRLMRKALACDTGIERR